MTNRATSTNRTPRLLLRVTPILIAASFLSGCYLKSIGSGFPALPCKPVPLAAVEIELFQSDSPAPTVKQKEWRHPVRTPLTVLAHGSPHHSAADPVVAPGEDALLRGKFAYGTVSKDLEDEEVAVHLYAGECNEGTSGGWISLGTGLTDRDGRFELSLGGSSLKSAGVYPYRITVRGDLSYSEGFIWVVPKSTDTVVFDIDGTLTTGDDEIFKELLSGTVPEMYEDADDVAGTYAASGYLPVYMTGRPYMLTATSRSWLRAMGFPFGPLKTTDSISETVPTWGGVGRYKAGYLIDLRDRMELRIGYAYGNAPTDICAYAAAGIPVDRTYIIGKHAGDACDGYDPAMPVFSYTEHLAGHLIPDPKTPYFPFMTLYGWR